MDPVWRLKLGGGWKNVEMWKQKNEEMKSQILLVWFQRLSTLLGLLLIREKEIIRERDREKKRERERESERERERGKERERESWIE